MKRLLATALVALVSLGGLTACAGDDAAVTVNGETVLTQDEVDELLDGIAGSEDLLTSVDGRGAGTDTVDANFVATQVVGNAVLSELLRQDLAERDVDVSDQDVADGRDFLVVVNQNPGDGSAPLTLDQLPADFEDLSVGLYARFAAVLRSFGGDAAELARQFEQPVSTATQEAFDETQARLFELTGDADVEIDPRLGRWVVTDGAGTVEAPSGPAGAEG